MKDSLKLRPDEKEDPASTMSAEDWRLERLIDRAPNRIRSTVRFLRQPSSRWLRIPAGSLLTVGGVLWFLPIAGLWMLPIGLALLADDVPVAIVAAPKSGLDRMSSAGLAGSFRPSAMTRGWQGCGNGIIFRISYVYSEDCTWRQP